MKRQQALAFALVLAALWLAGLYLRLPILIIPPLEPAISRGMALGQAMAGALTTLPMLMLSIGAVAGSAIVGRLGARTGVVLGLVVIAIASAARGLAPPVSVLFLATVITGLGIAVMQPALAALANILTPARVALAIGVYMNGMYTGEFLSAGLTRLTLLPWVGGDWRLALLFASFPALPIAVLIALIGRKGRGTVSDMPASRRVALWPNWRSGVMWRLGLLVSATSILFIGTNAYMADIVGGAEGASSLTAALFWFNMSQVVVSLGMLLAARWLQMRRVPIIFTMLVSIISALVFVSVGSTIGLIAAFVLGMATAAQLTLVLMAAPQLAPSGETARMTAGIFTIGYSLAFLVPLIGGGFAEWIGIPWAAMLPMIAYALAISPIALTLRLEPHQTSAA